MFTLVYMGGARSTRGCPLTMNPAPRFNKRVNQKYDEGVVESVGLLILTVVSLNGNTCHNFSLLLLTLLCGSTARLQTSAHTMHPS
jgi:hypothetical protein